MKSKSTIRRNLKELRSLIDSSNDLILRRIAYAMEHAVRWATEDTVGWHSLAREAEEEAKILRGEL